MFRMPYLHISDVLWDVLEWLVATTSKLVTNLQGDVLACRATTYAEAIFGLGAPLSKYIGFIDFTKVNKCRPVGDG